MSQGAAGGSQGPRGRGSGGRCTGQGSAEAALWKLQQGQGQSPCGLSHRRYCAPPVRASLGVLFCRPAGTEYKATVVAPPFPGSAEPYASSGGENRHSSCFLRCGDCCYRQLLWQVFTQLCKAKPLPRRLMDFPRSAPKPCQCFSLPVRLKFVYLQV